MNTNKSFQSIANAYKRKNQGGQESTQTLEAPTNDINEAPAKKKPIINAFNKYEIQKSEPVYNNTNKYLKDTETANALNGPTRRKPKMVNVSKNQKGNKLLDVLTKNAVPWQYVSSTSTTKVLYDYSVWNNKRLILFLSLKYHKLHPEYLPRRMKYLRQQNCILLVLVDIEEHENILTSINKECLFGDFTLILSWSYDQCGKYIQFLA
ncbi:DNA repair protein HuRAD10 [Hanseniaspora uvarum DSM 2768]|nr:DNA repair protein HuRAD10 [Hanseniaspora uvarum DSM 2768]